MTALDDCSYRLANKSTKYYKTLSSNIAKIVRTVKSQIKSHFFGSKGPFFIIGFLATFMLACDTTVSTEDQKCRYYPIKLTVQL